MAQKNIVINLANADPDYVSSDIRYARIDNTASPVYTSILGVTSSPVVISNVPNGQYRIYAKPNYSDGRVCPEQVFETSACSGINALSAIFDDPDIVISYSASDDVPQIRINISYPNGGFSSTVHDNDGLDINIAPPADVFGTYFITIQPVCDADTEWYGLATAPVTVEIAAPSP